MPENGKRMNKESKNRMFAAILRRWRLVTPLALAVLAVAVVTSGVLASASAHTVHFHFWGRATVLEDNSIVLPDFGCDTGPQSSLDGTQINFSNSPCIPIFGGVGTSTTNGQNEVGEDLFGLGPGSPQTGVVATVQLANASVKTDNTSKEGHTISTTNAYGLTIALCNQASGDGDCDGDDNVVDLLTAVQLQVIAEAECELSHNQTHASARATTAEVFNDLFVLEGFHTVFVGGVPTTVPVLAHLTPSGAANETFPIFNIVTLQGVLTTFFGPSFNGPVTEQITVNEQKRFHDGGISWIKVTGVHMIMTNASGTVILNLSVDVNFAAIHCEKHLPNDDAIGA
jgi:hypothetical protein